jgi:hypothetical protein
VKNSLIYLTPLKPKRSIAQATARRQNDKVRDHKMKRYVTSTGGPLIIMEASLYPQWGGALSNSASKYLTTDYDFACQTDRYLSLAKITNGQIIILGDMPMDTAVVQDRPRSAVYLVRVMYGDTDDEDVFIFSNYDSIFANENEIQSESLNDIAFKSSQMILANSSEASAFSLGSKHHLFFDLGASKCSIRTFDHNGKHILAIVHALMF